MQADSPLIDIANSNPIATNNQDIEQFIAYPPYIAEEFTDIVPKGTHDTRRDSQEAKTLDRKRMSFSGTNSFVPDVVVDSTVIQSPLRVLRKPLIGAFTGSFAESDTESIQDNMKAPHPVRVSLLNIHESSNNSSASHSTRDLQLRKNDGQYSSHELSPSPTMKLQRKVMSTLRASISMESFKIKKGKSTISSSDVLCNILNIRGTFCILTVPFFKVLPIHIPRIAEFMLPMPPNTTHRFSSDIEEPDTATYVDTESKLFIFYIESLSRFFLESEARHTALLPPLPQPSIPSSPTSPVTSLFNNRTSIFSKKTIITPEIRPQSHILILREEMRMYPLILTSPNKTRFVNSLAEQRALRKICVCKLLASTALSLPFKMDPYITLSDKWMYREEESECKIVSYVI